MNKSLYGIIKFQKNVSKNGTLIVLEKDKEINFDIKRIFYIIDNNDNLSRGNHANINSHFILISIVGTCKVSIDDGFENITIFELNNPSYGLYISNLIWKKMFDFSKDCILLILSNNNYDPNEYIHDYQAFLNIIKEKNDNK